MIYDSIENAHIYMGSSKDLDLTLNYLCQTDFAKMSAGRYELDGDRVYVMIQDYETTSPDDERWEAHQNYADVQFLFLGREDIGVAPRKSLIPVTEYNKAEDCTFMRGHGALIELNPGYFVVLWPDDAHMPGRTLKDAETVRKVVIKIKLLQDQK